MESRSGDYSHTVFKLTARANLTDYDLDVSLLNVAWAMDGKRSLSVVAEEDRYDLEDLIRKVQRLLALGVIEVSQGTRASVDRGFIDFLCGQLSKSLGPIADFLIADTANDLGHPVTDFPVHKLTALINLLAQEIGRQEDAIAFKNAMAAMMQKKKY